MGFFSGGSTISKNDSYSGLRTGDANLNGGFVNLLKRTPQDFNFAVDALKARTQDTNPFQLNSQGFTAPQMEGVNQFGKNLFNSVSSNYAGRGFLAPDNVAGVIGSAVTQASPTLMQQIYQNQAANQDAQSTRFGQLNQALAMYSGLLGGEDHSFAKQTAPGIGYTFGNSFANKFGDTLGQRLGNIGGGPSGGGGVQP